MILYILFPYIEIVIVWLLSKLSLSFWIYLLLIIFLFGIYILLYIMTIVHLVINCNKNNLVYNNLGIKLGYFPLHCGLLLLSGAMGNPFLFLFMGIPLIFSAFFTIITGILSTICFVKSNVNKRKKTKHMTLKIILSYIVILDVIVSIIEFISIKKK